MSNSNPSNLKDNAELVLILIAKGLVDLYARIKKGQPFEYENYSQKLQKGYNKLTAFYLESGQKPPSSIVELVNWCEKKPLIDWNLSLPEDAVSEDDYLLQEQEPTDLCYQLKETQDSDEGEFQKKLILEVMNIAKTENNPQLYRDFRRMLIEHPIVDYQTKQKFKNKMRILSEQIDHSYQEISEQYQFKGNFYQCDRCGYLMQINLNHSLVCGNIFCRQKYHPPKSTIIEGIDPFYLVHDDIFRYITLPGKPELELEQALKKYDNVEVEMWTEYDQYDLYLKFADGEKWAIDVKDWKNPYWLAKNVNSKPFAKTPLWDQAFYVFPDYRKTQKEDYKRAFRKYFQQKGIDVLFTKELLTQVKQKMEKINA